MINFEKKIFNLIKKVTKKKTAIHPPIFNRDDIHWVTKCIKSSYVSTKGDFTKKLENEIKKIIKSKYAIATNSGTSGLELALRIFGVKANDEVLVPSMTFVGSVNAIKYCNAIPNFVDSDILNLGIDSKKLENYLNKILKKKGKFYFNKITNRRVYAIILVHTFGMPGDIEDLIRISKKYNLKVLEDASEAIGSLYNKKSLGTFGDAGVISFNANKIVTTGGGGVIITNNRTLAKKAIHLSSTAKCKHPWELKHNDLGWNTRMPAINASLGFGKLKNFKKILKSKRDLAFSYKKVFRKFEDVKFFDERKNNKSNFWLNAIILEDSRMNYKERILNYCNQKGVECRPIWNLISEMKIYKKCPKSDLSNAKKLFRKIICIPSGLNLNK